MDPTPSPGIMIVVVGPSGAGKDSLINLARAHYADDPCVGFVRRVITRPADGATEDHVPATVDDFEEQKRRGGFAVSWGAHGLFYGIPAETRGELDAGRVLIANGSRAAIGAFVSAYPHVAVVEVTARPDIIAGRLAARGRETAHEIEKRLARDTGQWQPDCPHIRIDNSGALAEASIALIAAIDSFATGTDG